MQVSRSGECRNSPKNAFVEDYVIDLLTNADLGARSESAEALPPIPPGISSVHVHHAISHGKIGAANGKIGMAGKDVPFAVVLEFVNTKASTVRKAELYLGQNAG